MFGQCRVEIPVAVDRTAIGQPDAALWRMLADAGCHLGQCAAGDERSRLAVRDDVARLLGGQVAVDRGQVQAGTQCRPHHVVERHPVVHEHGDVVTAAQPGGMQQLRQSVGTRVQFGVGALLPAAGVDDGGFVRADLRPVAWIHRAASCLRSGRPIIHVARPDTAGSQLAMDRRGNCDYRRRLETPQWRSAPGPCRENGSTGVHRRRRGQPTA